MTSSENSVHGSAETSTSTSYVDTQTHQPDAGGVILASLPMAGRESESPESAGVASSAMPEEAHDNDDATGAVGQQIETTTSATPGPVPTSASRSPSVAATINTQPVQAQQTTMVPVTEGEENFRVLRFFKKTTCMLCCCCDEEL